MPISLEGKLKALREVENIYRLSKKWQRLTPNEKRPNWERIADAVLRKALNEPIQAPPESLDVRHDQQMHQHSPRSARAIERTLRNGVVHPDVLHSFRADKQIRGRRRIFHEKKPPLADTPAAIHYVQHGHSDLAYPSGHLQGFGFVPSDHEVASHVQLEDSVKPVEEAVPTKATPTGASGYT